MLLKRRKIVVAVALTLAGCGHHAPSAEVRTTILDEDAFALRASIARVERGLGPELNAVGERAGWSIEERMSAHHIPGVSIAVIQDFRVAWARAYGVADAGTGQALTPDTRMQAGSISKLVTAVAALKAVEAGRVALDSSVNASLRSWQLPETAATRGTPVTLRQLLSHTAGVNNPGGPGYLAGEPLPTLLQVLEGLPPANTPPVRVSGSPGATYRYSSGGTTIVQQLLIDTYEQPFPVLMQNTLFGPLGLAHSSFDEPVEPAAAAHDIDGRPLPGKHRRYPEMAAGGLWSTPSDLASLLVQLQRSLHAIELGGDERSNAISSAIASQMTTSTRATGEHTDVSLGTFIERHGSGVYIGHDGLGEGFVTMARFSKKDGTGAVLMANGWAGFTGAPLLIEIMRSIAAEYKWEGWLLPPVVVVPIEARSLDAMAGAYGEGADRAFLLERRGDRLVMSQPFKEPCALEAIAVDTLVCRSNGDRFHFRRSEVVRTSSAWPNTARPTTFVRVATMSDQPLFALEANREADALARYMAMKAANPTEPAVSEERFESIGRDLIDRQRSPVKAASVFRVDVALHPESPKAWAALAEAEARMGRRAEAALRLARAKELFSREPTMDEWERTVLKWRLSLVDRLIRRTD